MFFPETITPSWAVRSLTMRLCCKILFYCGQSLLSFRSKRMSQRQSNRSTSSAASPNSESSYSYTIKEYEDVNRNKVRVNVQRRNGRVAREQRFPQPGQLLQHPNFVPGDSFSFETITSIDSSNSEGAFEPFEETLHLNSDTLFWEELWNIQEEELLDELLFLKSTQRVFLLQKLLEKIYPDDTGFWLGSSEMEMESNCLEVCGWFGFASDEDIVKGSASPEDQMDFWLNITSAVGSLEEYGGFSEGKMLDAVGKLEGHLKKIKDGVIRVGGVCGGSREGDKFESTGNLSEAKQVFQNIADMSSDGFKRINAWAEDLLAPERNFKTEPGVLCGTGAQVAALAEMPELMSLFSSLCSLQNTGTLTRSGPKIDETNHLSILVGNTQLSLEKLLSVASSQELSSPKRTKNN